MCLYSSNKVFYFKLQAIDAFFMYRMQTHKISQQAELQSMANTLLNARLTHTSNLLAQTQIAIARLQDKAASGERRIP